MPTSANPGSPSRRAVVRAGLGAGGLAAVALLGGCRLRLEDDAPPVPFIPRKSINDEALLIEGYRQARELAALAAAVPGSELAHALAGHHDRQAVVLRGVLSNGGVPSAVVEPTSTATASPTPATPASASTKPSSASLAATESLAVVPAALSQLAGAVANRPLLTAITAHRACAATLLGAPPTWPDRVALPVEVAPAALEPTHEAVYATEVAAARVPPAERSPFLGLLDILHRRAGQLRAAAGAQANGGSLAYRLPFAVATPDDARRLVLTVLDALVARGLDPLGVLPVGAPAVTEVARLQAEAAVLRQQWGGALTPFPGLVDG